MMIRWADRKGKTIKFRIDAPHLALMDEALERLPKNIVVACMQRDLRTALSELEKEEVSATG